MFGHLVQGAKSSCVTDLYAPELNLIDTLLAAGEELNFSILDAWDIVHKSNMSKLCTTQDEVESTQRKYKGEGIETEAVPVEDGLTAVKRKSDGKVLKNINWQEPKIVTGHDPFPF